MKRYIVPVLIFVVAFVLGAKLRFTQQTEAAAKPKPVAATPSSEEKMQIRTEGRVVAYPNAEVNVGTDVAGTILYLPVKERDHVSKGQVIAELRSDDLRASMNQGRLGQMSLRPIYIFTRSNSTALASFMRKRSARCRRWNVHNETWKQHRLVLRRRSPK